MILLNTLTLNVHDLLGLTVFFGGENIVLFPTEWWLRTVFWILNLKERRTL